MNSKTLAATFATALSRQTARPQAREETTADVVLINALRNSVTERDQIVMRRIGMAPDGSPEKP
jgi:hypothetical protein